MRWNLKTLLAVCILPAILCWIAIRTSPLGYSFHQYSVTENGTEFALQWTCDVTVVSRYGGHLVLIVESERLRSDATYTRPVEEIKFNGGMVQIRHNRIVLPVTGLRVFAVTKESLCEIKSQASIALVEESVSSEIDLSPEVCKGICEEAEVTNELFQFLRREVYVKHGKDVPSSQCLSLVRSVCP